MGGSRLALLALAALTGVAASPPLTSATLLVAVEGLRGHKGNLMYCLTRQTADYLACDKDPHSVHGTVTASKSAIEFDRLAPGNWALLLVHDSNSNGRFDKRFGIPREGFGFSGNPPMRLGPPSAGDVTFAVPAGPSKQVVRIKYIF